MPSRMINSQSVADQSSSQTGPQ